MQLNFSKPISQDGIDDIRVFLLGIIAEITHLPSDTFSYDFPLISLGLSSLMAVEMLTKIEKKYAIKLSYEDLSSDPTIQTIANAVFNQINHKKPLSVNTEPFSHSEKRLSPSIYDVRILSQYKKLTLQKALFRRANVEVPFHRCFHSSSTNIIQFDQRHLINFASYNYLGYNHDPRINRAASEAIQVYGTSASSSRIVSGEKNIHRQLESAIARLYGVEQAMVLVSGYGTNVSVITHLLDKNDLVIHDSLAHNSITMGATYSNAKRFKFPHNDMVALEELLKKQRPHYERVLIVVEGLYSMDGDTCPLPDLIRIKKKYQCLLMVDEAHSIGVLGDHGFGIREHYHTAPDDVDIWMGTLSKSFAGCGGYIAGCEALIDYLKFTLPGYIFSVGISPPLAAASLCAIELLLEDSTQVKLLHRNSQLFLSLAHQNSLNTGLAEGYGIVPIIIGHSLNTAQLANLLFQQGINVQPIIYPGVSENAARLRFFISALHTPLQISQTIEILRGFL